MRLASLILISLLTLSTQLFAQNIKIGYADIQLVLSRMPETESMRAIMSTYQNKLREKIATKQSYAETKYQEFIELQQEGASEETLTPLAEELQRLDRELQEEQVNFEQQVMARQQELLEPILEKLQGVVDQVAEEKGYTFILSKVDGTGSSMVLYGPEEHDMTLTIMEKMGIAPQAQN